jgi:NADH:ubiquinone oxidoreductase subunit 4 (subunit M)
MLYCTFRRIGLLSFYIFFESRLIPTLFLILGWGYQPEQVQAGIYLLFYTLLASLLLLVGHTFEDGTDTGYRNVGSKNSDAGEIPRIIYIRITTQ